MIHIGGIGDFLLTCPAIRALSVQGDVIVAGYPDRLQIAVDGTIAISAYSLDEIGFDSVFTIPNDRLCEAVLAVDRVIVWMHDKDGAIRRGLESIGEAAILIVDPLPPDDFGQHASVYYTHCLGLPEQPLFKLHYPPADIAYDVVIHPGSGDPKKNWPLEQFEALAEALEAHGRQVTWCIGPAEQERMLRLPKGTKLHCESLQELATNLVGARQFIGNDSGITHLSAALGIPTLALFKDTNPTIWAPRGAHVQVMQQKHVSIKVIIADLR